MFPSALVDIEPLKDAFWAIVVDCLVEFHGVDRARAVRDADRLRTRISTPVPLDGPPQPWEPHLFYHNEPFYI